MTNSCKGAPLITVVIVNKRHNTRLFPIDVHTNHKARALHSGNCVPGTIVDSGITSPYYFDFFLQSHSPLEGTARPAHYFVLENGIDYKPKVLQDLTFQLCHTYARSTTSGSYVPPVYYADRLCERGRLYLQPFHEKAEQYKIENLKEEQVMEKAKEIFYPVEPDKNPWHAFHNDKMFWM